MCLRPIYVMGSQLHSNIEWDYNLRVASLLYPDIDILFWDSLPCDEIVGGGEHTRGRLQSNQHRITFSDSAQKIPQQIL